MIFFHWKTWGNFSSSFYSKKGRRGKLRCGDFTYWISRQSTRKKGTHNWMKIIFYLNPQWSFPLGRDILLFSFLPVLKNDSLRSFFLTTQAKRVFYETIYSSQDDYLRLFQRRKKAISDIQSESIEWRRRIFAGKKEKKLFFHQSLLETRVKRIDYNEDEKSLNQASLSLDFHWNYCENGKVRQDFFSSDHWWKRVSFG